MSEQNPSHLRIFTDLEYCYPGMEKGQPRPTSKDQRQIVQIAAIVVNTKTGEELASLDLLVRPAFMTALPSFFTDLTGITQEMVTAKAVEFPAALAAFANFCSVLPVWTFNADEEVWRQNCGYFGVSFPLVAPFVRVKSLLPAWGIDPSKYSSGTLYKAAGLKIEGHVHNALHDIRSMAAAVHYFETKGQH